VKEAAALFKQEQPTAIVCLGDIVDAAPTVEIEAAYLKTITAAMDESGIPRHHVLGNHCVSTLTKAEFFEHGKTTTKAGHFSFDLGDVHFVILDACYNSKMEPYGRNNFAWTDTNIPPSQQAWLTEDLDKTDKKTVVFAHQRLDLKPEVNYAVKQCVAIRSILEKSKKILAVFQGHSHKNELKTINGIPYCTLAAVVEGSGVENNSYSLLDVMNDGKLVLKGYRKQEDRALG
jgi:predicted phosphodiesterase